MAKGRVGLGRKGEALAAQVLEQHGYTLVVHNWYCSQGEVDIVAEREGELIFFEVRTRRGKRYGVPEESVTPQKRARMEAVARRYLAEQPTAVDVAWHLGFVAVQMDRRGQLLRITIYSDLDGEPWDATI